MSKQRIHSNLGELDILTHDELASELGKHADKITRIHARTIKLMKLPIVSINAPTAGNLILANTGPGSGAGQSSAPCGPDSGFLWMLRRITITSSGGYTTEDVPLTQATLSNTGSVTNPGAFAAIAAITLPATTVPVVWNLQWTASIATAVATVLNNFVLQIGGVTKSTSLTPLAIGQYGQIAFTYIQPAGASVLVNVKSNNADSGGGSVYGAQLTADPVSVEASVGAGDTAQVGYLYIGSDTSQNQNTILEGGGINLGDSYYPGTDGAWVFPGEQIYASLSGVTAGNTYTLTGVAIEVAAEEVAKLIS
jgi:hypothetical protein